MSAKTLTRSLRMVALLAAAGVAAACGGATSGGTAGAPAAPAHLTDSKGDTLYLFAADHDGQSVCTGECASFWPPLAAGTQVQGSGGSTLGATQSTVTRPDGSEQVTVAGHPVYRYSGDHAPGQTTGQGLNIEGGLWWMVSTSGTAITTSPAPSSSTGSGSYGGGYSGGGLG